MNPDELASLVQKRQAEQSKEERERKEAEERARREQVARDKRNKRYVTLEEKDGGLSLTLRAFEHERHDMAGVYLILGATAALFALLWFVYLLIPAVLLLVAGLWFFSRITYRIMLTPAQHFALFLNNANKPTYYGSKDELSLALTSFARTGDKAIRLDVEQRPPWKQLIHGIEHPEDIAQIETFIQRLKP